MGRQLTTNVMVVPPSGGTTSFRLLESGSDLPDWAVDQVGDHALTPAEPVGHEASTVEELKAEIDRRNADGRADDQHLKKTGSKADLIAALAADDATTSA